MMISGGVILLLLATFSCATPTKKDRSKKAIVLAVGGYRSDYASDQSLGGIRRLNKEGVSASDVYPVYPALSYTNLYSLVTGLYAENHGVVGDIIYNQDTDEFYQPNIDKNSSKASTWMTAEPIWTTAEKLGRKTAIYWWPGCDIEIDGVHPSVCEIPRTRMKLEGIKIDFLERIEDIIEMFKRDELDLAFLYYDLMEEMTMMYGTNSVQRENALQIIDDILLQIMEKLDNSDLQNEVNVLLVSNSGISDVNHKVTKYLDINQFKNNIQYQVMFGALSMILPILGKEEKLFDDLKHAGMKGLTVFKKPDIPTEYHIKGNKRVLPILLQAQDGYFINPLYKENSQKQDKKVKGPNYLAYQAVNGYDSILERSMRTVFFAKGPAFKKRVVIPSISNVDIYNVICRAIGMKGLPNNGSKTKIDTIFIDSDYVYEVNSAAATNTISFFIILPFFICLLLKL